MFFRFQHPTKKHVYHRVVFTFENGQQLIKYSGTDEKQAEAVYKQGKREKGIALIEWYRDWHLYKLC